MSAVGSDAAFMLEKALEEMDDIFRDSEQQSVTFMHQSTPEPPALPHKKKSIARDNPHMVSITKILDELEYALSSHVLDNQQELNNAEKRALISYIHSLNFVSMLFEDLSTTEQDIQSYLKGPEEKIHNLEQERNYLLTQVNKFHNQQILTETELNKTRKSLTDYARKNEELLIRITEHRIAEKNKPKPTVRNRHKKKFA